MALYYGFYNSVNGDRKYNATQFCDMFDGVINDGVFANVAGIFGTIPGEGLQVLIRTGRAWFNKTWNYNDAIVPLKIDAPDVVFDRIDTVVLEVDARDSGRVNSLKIIKGSPSTNPIAPALTTEEKVYQHPLSNVRVRANAVDILASDITILVGTSQCPFVTAILQTTNIDVLYANWEQQFKTWFDNLKAQLNDNVVANLQGQIDGKVNISDKATAAEVNAMSIDTKWVTPASLKTLTTNMKATVNDPVLGTTSTFDKLALYAYPRYAREYGWIPTNALSDITPEAKTTGPIWLFHEPSARIYTRGVGGPSLKYLTSLSSSAAKKLGTASTAVALWTSFTYNVVSGQQFFLIYQNQGLPCTSLSSASICAIYDTVNSTYGVAPATNHRMVLTKSYFVAVNVSSNTTITFYRLPRTSSGTVSTNCGSFTRYSSGLLTICGIYDDVIFFLYGEQSTNTIKMGVLDVATASVTLGVTTISDTTLYHLGQTDRYIYFLKSVTGTSTNTVGSGYMVYDMATRTINSNVTGTFGSYQVGSSGVIPIGIYASRVYCIIRGTSPGPILRSFPATGGTVAAVDVPLDIPASTDYLYPSTISMVGSHLPTLPSSKVFIPPGVLGLKSSGTTASLFQLIGGSPVGILRMYGSSQPYQYELPAYLPNTAFMLSPSTLNSPYGVFSSLITTSSIVPSKADIICNYGQYRSILSI